MPISRRTFLVGGASALVLAACSGDDDDSNGAEATDTTAAVDTGLTVQNQPDPVQGPNGSPSEIEDGVYEIVAENTMFLGNTVSAVAGEVTTIRVTNRDQVTHNLRLAGLDGQYDSEDDAVTEPAAIEPGTFGELSFAPTIPGAYTFRCDYHPGSMGGQVVVE